MIQRALGHLVCRPYPERGRDSERVLSGSHRSANNHSGCRLKTNLATHRFPIRSRRPRPPFFPSETLWHKKPSRIRVSEGVCVLVWVCVSPLVLAVHAGPVVQPHSCQCIHPPWPLDLGDTERESPGNQKSESVGAVTPLASRARTCTYPFIML